MNLCFVLGQIISEVRFDFILHSKNISVTRFEVELGNKSKIKVKGYNEIAEECYQKLRIGDRVLIRGNLDSKGIITIQELKEWE